MVEFIFPYYLKHGRNDISESEISCLISNKDASRLKNSAEEGGRFHLDEDNDIEDIYNKVCKKIRLLELEILLEKTEIVEDWLSWEEDYIPGKKITKKDVERYLDELTIGINYPRELQMLENTRKRSRLNSKYENVIVNREEVNKYLSDENNQKTKVVFVDGGETLYWVPKKYSGLLTIPSSVRNIEKDAIYKRNNITDIVIEEGLKEIKEIAFASCENLKKVSIPASVKKIDIRAFGRCGNLEEVNLSEGLQEIHPQAFEGCYSLRTLALPASLPEVSSLIAGGGSQSFRDFYFMGKDTEITGVWAYLWERKKLHVLSGSKAEKFAIDNNLKYEIMSE